MGALARTEGADREAVLTNAFRHIIVKGFSGVVLSGTTSAAHLADNLKCFANASVTAVSSEQQHLADP